MPEIKDIKWAVEELKKGEMIEFDCSVKGSKTRTFIGEYLIHDHRLQHFKVEKIRIPERAKLEDYLPAFGTILCTGYVEYHEVKSIRNSIGSRLV